MKHTIILLSYACCLLTALAAVPLRWTVETSRATPAQFEAYQGETLYFEAALQSDGKPFEAPLNYSLFWQTNGMGRLYWEAPCSRGGDIPVAATNVLFATWLPSYDVGAKVYNCFIGSPSNNYHTAFQLRLRPSPGATPNALPLPTPVIDFAKVRVLNPPWESGGGGVNTNAVREIAAEVVAPVASSVSDLESSVSGLASSKLDKSDVIDPATATTNGQAADAKATKDALDLKANVPMSWYPNYIVIFDGNGNFVNGAASVEELMLSIDAKISGSNPYGSGGVGWNDEAGFVFDACRVLLGYGSVLNAVSGDRIVFENDGNEETIDERIVRLAPRYVPSATDETFSNAVLAVGLNIDTNSVAVLNEIAATFGGFPITGTATTVGGLLAALAAAVAWLRKNKIDKLKVTGMTAEATAENGVAKLDDFFKESNSLLTGTIEAKVNSMFDNGDTTSYPRPTEV